MLTHAYCFQHLLTTTSDVYVYVQQRLPCPQKVPHNCIQVLPQHGERCAGINTAIYSPSGANSGVGFAVPVDLIRSSVNQIIQFGKVLRPILGISFAPDQSVEQVRGIKQHLRECTSRRLLMGMSLVDLTAGGTDSCLPQLPCKGWRLHMQLQQGIQGILVLDARDGSPARLAGVHGTRRDQSGRLVLGDIISAFNGRKVK